MLDLHLKFRFEICNCTCIWLAGFLQRAIYFNVFDDTVIHCKCIRKQQKTRKIVETYKDSGVGASIKEDLVVKEDSSDIVTAPGSDSLAILPPLSQHEPESTVEQTSLESIAEKETDKDDDESVDAFVLPEGITCLFCSLISTLMHMAQGW